MKNNIYEVNVPNSGDSFIIEIEQDINRPNNPEDYDIIQAYVRYNYGDKVVFYYTEMQNVITINSEWNIENYR